MSSQIRQPMFAGQFYEATASALRQDALDCAAGFTPPSDITRPLGGVVPHAGWMFSGFTAAKVFKSLAAFDFETYVLLGAVHGWRGRQAAAYPAGAWKTPLGEMPIDTELLAALVKLAEDDIVVSDRAHAGEHSIEVQLPFIQMFTAGAAILPIAVPPEADAIRVGQAVARAIRQAGRRAAIVASSDLTHYGLGYGSVRRGTYAQAREWMRENDFRIIRLIEKLDAESIQPEAAESMNACGPGALAASVAAVTELGAARARVLEYTTSADVTGETSADRAVGYVGMLFERSES